MPYHSSSLCPSVKLDISVKCLWTSIHVVTLSRSVLWLKTLLSVYSSVALVYLAFDQKVFMSFAQWQPHSSTTMFS